MKANYAVENEVYLNNYKELLNSIVVFNYNGLNEVVNHFVSFSAGKKDQITTSNLVGFWRIKKLKQ